MNIQIEDTKPIGESLKEYTRGLTGGLLFSFPLLYTMEVWWAGFITAPGPLLILIFLIFLLLLGYNRFAGLRPDSTWKEVAIDSVEELGLGLIVSFAVLLMLNRIQLQEMAVDEIMGKVIIEAMVVSIGISIGTAQLGAGNGGGKTEQKADNAARTGKLAIGILAICGGLIIGANVAPTQEVLMIAIEAHPVHILLICIISLLICVIVNFFIDFKGSQTERPANFHYHLIFDTSMCYSAALAVSAFVLWFFGRFENMDFYNSLAQVIVLGLISSLGASAGRLLIK